jgi:light-regulated signal transduction histidine kinase (bacteriophytochrome)
VIKGYSELILAIWGTTLEEKCRGYVEHINQGALQMNRLIGSILQFSLAKRKELHPVTVDLSAMAETIASELKLAEPDRHITFRIAGGITASGDRNLLLVVMENLLGNAWKYTGSRQEGEVEFGVLEDPSGVPTYFVRDNGIGFDMSQADRLFVPFKRLDGAEAFKGEGIGLATVERIIRRHGGKIWAESRIGEGATFFWQLGGRGPA